MNKLAWRASWRGHKNNAKARGIGFHFSFEDWCFWWEANLGPDWYEKRGCRRGQYVMARYQDKGDYIKGNVKCVLVDENHREAKRRVVGRKSISKLYPEDVIELYLADEPIRVLAEMSGLARTTIEAIKRRKTHIQTTMNLGPPGRPRYLNRQ